VARIKGENAVEMIGVLNRKGDIYMLMQNYTEA
jgi:hypothetical protein